MKRALTVSVAAAVALLATSPQLLAQGAGERYGGLTGGATLSTFRGDVGYAESRWGGTAGLFAGYRPSSNTMVNLGTSWVQKGAKGTRLDYIEIPVTIGGMAPVSGDAFSAGAYVGVSLAIKIGCSADVDAACDAVNGSDWNIPFGIILAKRSGNKFFGIDARYDLGLSSLSDGSDAKNSAWLFQLIIGKSVGAGSQ